jgi:hypothetical protein
MYLRWFLSTCKSLLQIHLQLLSSSSSFSFSERLVAAAAAAAAVAKVDPIDSVVADFVATDLVDVVVVAVPIDSVVVVPIDFVVAVPTDSNAVAAGSVCFHPADYPKIRGVQLDVVIQ